REHSAAPCRGATPLGRRRSRKAPCATVPDLNAWISPGPDAGLFSWSEEPLMTPTATARRPSRDRTETGPSGSRTPRLDWGERWYARVSGACEPKATPPGRQRQQRRPRVEPTVAVWLSRSPAEAEKENSAVQTRAADRQSLHATPGKEGENRSEFRRPSIDF